MSKQSGPPRPVGERTAEEVAIIHPDRTVQLAGEAVTVRAFGFVEALGLERFAQPITRALRAILGPSKPGERVDVEAIMAALGDQREAFLQLAQVSTGRGRDFFDRLDDADGLRFMVAFWEVHAPFFVRRLVLAASAEAAQRPTGRSSPDSSAPATASTKSAGTPAPSSSSSSDSPAG